MTCRQALSDCPDFELLVRSSTIKAVFVYLLRGLMAPRMQGLSPSPIGTAFSFAFRFPCFPYYRTTTFL